MQTEKISASQAVSAYRWKAFQIQTRFNCVIEFVREAVTMAQDLDNCFRGMKKPPLFGVPFSVKENFHMKGYDCTSGLGKNIGLPMSDDSSLVAHLQFLGAVPIVRTNVPQTLLSFTCSNPIFGETLNPHNATRSAGGSSGGEACLIASGGCPFGIGSDLAGSLRIPAHFSGIASLKPTCERLKVTGTEPGIPGTSRIVIGYGFMAKDVSTLVTLFEAVLQPSYFERVPNTVPLPFHAYQSDSTKQLRIGFCHSDGWFPAVPAVQRAIADVIVALNEVPNILLVPFKIPEPAKALQLALKAVMVDNGKWWLRRMSQEPVDSSLKVIKLPIQLRLASLKAYMANVSDVRETFSDIDEYVTLFTKAWKENDMQALICPPFPFPAVAAKYTSFLSSACFSTVLFNMLNFPAGVVPVTEVTENDEADMLTYSLKFISPYVVQSAMKGSVGLPVGVQVVTLPFQEELCLALRLETKESKDRWLNVLWFIASNTADGKTNAFHYIDRSIISAQKK
ncbi:unnamed protein product [Soboliphyme baturini]|uniref:Amidase domain-containing protein n=1 Tax=Soboliphyme baturini TaxID=241478 RepID=A0A3P8A882_9BILA|nr:unnamed protein product [Soboliphyme baturini]